MKRVIQDQSGFAVRGTTRSIGRLRAQPLALLHGAGPMHTVPENTADMRGDPTQGRASRQDAFPDSTHQPPDVRHSSHSPRVWRTGIAAEKSAGS
jgi:hypothetical protein